MEQLFIKLLNMSLAAGWLVPLVILLRLLLKKSPKWLHCLLWALVALRLIIPFFPASTLSLLPSAQVIGAGEGPGLQTGIPAVNRAVNPVLVEAPQGGLVWLMSVLLTVWVMGIVLMCVYSVISYLRLRRQVSISIGENGVYICDDIDTPFILGVLRPRIYLPSGMHEEQQRHVLAHERAHLRRRDHWWKPLGYALLTVYWFHPLLWVGYILLCRDIEKACDEKVIRDMDTSGKKQYSEALLACSVHRRAVLACPLAFGEVAVKERIKRVLHYKKPLVWAVAAALILCAAVAAGFLTDPIPCSHVYDSRITMEATCTREGQAQYTCTQCWEIHNETVQMCAHRYDSGIATVAATCHSYGKSTYCCLDCGAKTSVQTPMIPHSWSEPYVTAPLSCTLSGQTVVNCTVCSREQVVAEAVQTEPHHTMVTTVITPATCTREGVGKNTCSVCNHTEDCALPLAEHNYREDQVMLPNCAHVGYRVMVCTACAREQWYELPKTDEHVWRESINGTMWCVWCYTTKIIPGKNKPYTNPEMPSSGSPDTSLPGFQWDP